VERIEPTTDFSISPVRCPTDPMPAVEKLSSGVALG
jgi:hypothetical protein